MSNKENFTFGLKNFRNYDAEGAEFVMAPITILTGCNSAGKSSLVKALMLMNNCMSSVYEKYLASHRVDAKQFKLNFVDRQFNVGRYDIALNNKAGKDELMCFSYKVTSPVINEEITVTYYFGSDSADILNNGWLKKLTIANKNQESIYSLDLINNSCEINGNLLKDCFSKAMTYLALVSPRYADDILWGIEHTCSKEDVDKAKERAEKLKLKYEESDIEWLNSLTQYRPFNRFFDPQKELYMYNAVKELNESGTLFYMPVFDVTKGLSKDEAVKYLRDFLADERKNWKPSESLKGYSHIECGLDKLIVDFEKLAADFVKSNHSSLLDFFLEYEQKMLFFVDNHITNKGNNIHITIHDVLNVYKPGSMVYDAQCMTAPRIGKEADVMDYCDAATSESSRCDNSEVDWPERDENEEGCKDVQKFERMVDYYSVFAEISMMLDKEESPLVMENPYGKLIHPIFNSYFSDFVKFFLFSVLPPEGMCMSYVGSSRVKVNRLYALDDQSDEFASLLTKYFTQLKDHKGNYIPGSFMNKWVKEFGIGDRISINNTEEGLGVLIKLHSSESDVEGHLLADEGYGITQFVSILLQIESAILSAEQVEKYYPQKLNLMPFYVMSEDRKQYKQENLPQTIAIEEPEIHLHPKYQSMLADMFLDAYKTYNIRFIVETHSEYLIRRFQVLVSDKQSGIDNSNIAIHYVENDETSKTNVRHIKVKEDGRLSEPFGHGFFDEADNLAFQLLENKAGNE